MNRLREMGKARFLGLALGAIVLAGGVAGSADANSPVVNFSVAPSTTQAGGHPDIAVQFKVGNSATSGYSNPCYCNDPKDVMVNLPTGFIGNPHATPRCGSAEFALQECPSDSQIGIAVVLLYKEAGVGGGVYAWKPLFNMVPRPDQAGLLAFPTPAAGGLPQYTVLKARTGSDYGLTATNVGVERFIPIYGVSQFLWGVPADPIHDPIRFKTGAGVGGLGFCINIYEFADPRQAFSENRFPSLPTECANPGPPTTSSNSPPVPFLSNPTACSGPLIASLDTNSYDNGTAHGDSPYPAVTGCELLSFNPSLSAKPTTEEADAPSGLDLDLSVPQFQSPSTPSPSAIRATTVTLPEGFSINPNAADGKASCSNVEASFGTEDEAHCPEFSKVGTLSVDSSALPAPIPGYIYLGDPKPGNRYRIILTADGYATHVKLAGSVFPDPQTGQLVTSFQELPETPLTEFKMHFFGSERGLLATPNQCGTYSVKSTFRPWDAALPEQDSTQFFTIDSGPGGKPCPTLPRSFSPAFFASSDGNTAGAYAPFSLKLDRADGDQNLTSLSVRTPPGFSARLKGIPYCPDSSIAGITSDGYLGAAERASSACPAASQIGTVIASVGAGSRPFQTPGRVFLAGPYKGAPVSLVAVVPAIAGPYDLGAVAVRAALYVDPVTAEVTTVSDPLPRILAGVPLRIRSIQVNLDRPNFTLNPTKCDPFVVAGTIGGEEGGLVSRSSHFQVANCAVLPYGPQLSLTLSGGVNRRGHPKIHAELDSAPGEANSHRISVTLPKGEFLDNAHIGTVCTRPEFARNSCPAGSLVGTVEVTSPLLDKPLAGPIYLRSSQHRLPDLALDLEGQFDIEATGRIDSIDGRLRTTFETIPDVPLSSVSFDLMGGAKGLLQNSTGLCGATKSAVVRMVGQNGDRADEKVKLDTLCGEAARRRRHRNRSGGSH